MGDPILFARLDALDLSLERVEKRVDWARDEYQLEESVWGTFYDTIVVPARRLCTRDLGAIRQQLASADHKDDAIREAEVKSAWEKYSRVYNESERLFAECVEFLGGLALRERGLDEGICQLADDLMGKCEVHTGAGWGSLTIPTRQEPVTVSLARIIRLRFPEWSIWTLPLAAHQFGHVVVDLRTDWQEKVRDEAGAEDERHLYDLLADGLATYLIGPAYACAAIRLSFDPLAAYTDSDEHAADAKRAHVVFGMLRRMDETVGAGLTPPYDRLIQILEKEWNKTLGQTNTQTALPEADPQRLRAWVETTWQMFQDLRPTALYPHAGRDGWQVAQNWCGQLLRGEPIELSGTESLRDALNAAWLCRIEAPHRTKEIADAAHRLCERIVEKRREIIARAAAQRARRTRQVRTG